MSGSGVPCPGCGDPIGCALQRRCKMERGVVKMASLHGFGFITPDAGGGDVYVSRRLLDSVPLKKGMPVEFIQKPGGRGAAATFVRVLQEEPRG